MGRIYQTSDFRNGLKVEIEGNPYVMGLLPVREARKGIAFTDQAQAHGLRQCPGAYLPNG